MANADNRLRRLSSDLKGTWFLDGRGGVRDVDRFLDGLRRFLAELKRRKVYRVAAAYLAAAFVGLEALDLLVPRRSRCRMSATESTSARGSRVGERREPMSHKIPWPRVLVEGIVIVASILLAFGIDAWWQNRQERRAERDYAARIVEDLREARAMITENAAHYEELLKHGRAIQPILTGVEPMPNDTLGFLASVLQASRITDPVIARSAYDDLISTGNLRVIESEAVRSALSRFYGTVDYQLNPVDYSADQVPYRETVRGILPGDLQMRIRETCLDAVPLSCGTETVGDRVGAVARAVVLEPGLERKLNLSMQSMLIRLGFVLDRGGFSGGFGVVLQDIDALLELLGRSYPYLDAPAD